MVRWIISGAVMSTLAVGIIASLTAAAIIPPDIAVQLAAIFAGLVLLLGLLGKHEAERVLGIIDRIPQKEWFAGTSEAINDIRNSLEAIRTDQAVMRTRTEDYDRRLGWLEQQRKPRVEG